jgi:hypothetical protein
MGFASALLTAIGLSACAGLLASDAALAVFGVATPRPQPVPDPG